MTPLRPVEAAEFPTRVGRVERVDAASLANCRYGDGVPGARSVLCSTLVRAAPDWSEAHRVVFGVGGAQGRLPTLGASDRSHRSSGATGVDGADGAVTGGVDVGGVAGVGVVVDVVGAVGVG